MPRHRLSIVAPLVALGAALLAGPATAGDALERAQQAYLAMDYHEMQPLLEQALTEAETPAEEVRVYELMAVAHAIYEREDEARAAYRELLARAPEFELPADTSPKLRALFDEVRAERAHEAAVVPSATETTGPAAAVTEVEAASTTTAVATSAPATVAPSDEPEEEPAPAAEESNDWLLWTAAGLGAVVVAAAGIAGIAAYTVTSTPPETDLGPFPL